MGTIDQNLMCHRAAIALHDAERELALAGLRSTHQFQDDLKRALLLREKILDGINSVANVTQKIGGGIFGLTGTWLSPRFETNGTGLPCIVISVPDGNRIPEIEGALANLGRLLGGTTRALTITVGHLDYFVQIVWHDEDVERIDITDAETLVRLFERLRWEVDPVVSQRFSEISEALRAGIAPPPPAYVWPTRQQRPTKSRK